MINIEFYSPKKQLIDTICIKQEDLNTFLQEIDGYPLHIAKQNREYYFTINKDANLKITQGCSKSKENNIIKTTIQNDKDYLINCEEKVEQSYINKLDKLLKMIK